MLHGRVVVRILIAALVATGVNSFAQESTSSISLNPKADALLRGVADQLSAARTFRTQMETAVRVTAEGVQNEMLNSFEIAVQRPNKIAFLHKEGVLGFTFVSDGTTLTLHDSRAQTHTIETAPENMDGVVEQLTPHAFASPGAIVAVGLVGGAPYDAIMDGVTSSVYVAEVELSGRRVHHIRCAQENFDWDAFISVADPPVLCRVTMDMAKRMQSAEEAMPQLGEMKMIVEVNFKDWEFNKKLPTSMFQYTPPADSIESIGGDDEIEEQSELLGRPAPDFDLPLLDGGRAQLSDLTSSVVVLDFWASWCGPCREGLSKVVKIADNFAGQDVKVFAINLMETTDTIRKFLDEENLRPQVALDSDGSVGNAYGAEAIPTTVMIGHDGRVQAVHTGISPNFEKRLTSEIEASLRGEDLVKAKPASESVPEESEKGAASALTKVWSLEGKYTGVAFDQKNSAILALGARKFAEVLLDGTLKHETAIHTDNSILRLAYPEGSSFPNLVTFTGWIGEVEVFSRTGEKLWAYSGQQGIDDVWGGNILGSNADEVVVGFNGRTGLHALDAVGKVLWKYTKIGNVWHVVIGDFNGDGANEVLSTSAAGKLHVFDSTGKKIKDIDPQLYGHMVRYGTCGGEPRAYVTGTSTKGEAIASFNFAGDRVWNTMLSKQDAHIVSASVSQSGEFMAVGMQGGEVAVVNCKNGSLLARLTGQGQSPEVAWANTHDANTTKPLLLVATGYALNAYNPPLTTTGTDPKKWESAVGSPPAGNKRVSSNEFLKMIIGKSVREVRDLLGKPYSFAPGEEYAVFYGNPVAGMEVYDKEMDTVPPNIQILFQNGKVAVVYYSE